MRATNTGALWRAWGLVFLALALLFLSACSLPQIAAQPGQGLRANPTPGLAARNLRVGGGVRASVLPVFNADSIEISGAWQVPPVPDPQYGPIHRLRACGLGGALAPPATLPGDMSAAKCVILPGNVTTTAILLPFDLSGMGDLTGSVWKVRLCVTTIRHNREGPQVCGEHEFPLDTPAPVGVTGLSVSSRIVVGGTGP